MTDYYSSKLEVKRDDHLLQKQVGGGGVASEAMMAHWATLVNSASAFLPQLKYNTRQRFFIGVILLRVAAFPLPTTLPVQHFLCQM